MVTLFNNILIDIWDKYDECYSNKCNCIIYPSLLSFEFRQLGKRLEDSDEPQYAGFCYLATGQIF